MLILFWIICLLLFLSGVITLAWGVMQSPSYKEYFQVLGDGYRAALRGCGLSSQKRYPVELWRWEITNFEDVCEDCRERASWPPMDIADWMKMGLPGTPEAETQCGANCSCRLVRYDPSRSKKPTGGIL